MTDEFEIRITGRFETRASLRRALKSQAVTVGDALQTLESRQQPYAVTLAYAAGRSGSRLSLVDVCDTMLATFFDFAAARGPSPGRLPLPAEVNASSLSTNAEGALELTLRALDEVFNVPTGTLLLDDSRAFSGTEDEIESWRRSIEQVLSSNVLARAGAEYALVIDLPACLPNERGTAWLRGLDLARLVATTLPAEAGGTANLVELRIRLRDDLPADGAQARMRIWRLGFMKIATRERFA